MLRKRILASIAAGVMAATMAVIAPTASSQAEVSAQACTFTNWVQGQWYTTGSIVKFENSYYIAEHDNPGYSPTVSTWYWEPTSCDGGGGGGGGGTCASATDWVAGRAYVTGNIVRYNGSYYIAEHDNPGYDPTISTWFWEPHSCDGGGGGGGGSFVVSEAQFNQMFPRRDSFYTYSGLLEAMSAFPAFAKTGGDTVSRQEAAAFLANVSHETGGLVYKEEIDQSGDYCDETRPYGCPAGNRYFGRGPIQLSWNFNYKAAGDYIGMDLLRFPDEVARQAPIAWKTGLWYWNTQSGPGSMTGHAAMTNGSGFGHSIRSINGSLECDGRNPAQVQSRVSKYQEFAGILGVPTGANLYC
ncbi:Predicted chitinase [Lentzea albidocapillata subsp. violacea]|uniref:Predicted chitinase n=1 Tax=Lentzea albidocapillata subsp. violacea TaxID=128104 RepID=A0A1G9RFS5_9PSEU|nr:glycoside hydrolase family 19 protein [Lentzea albidocapillata]SDM22169.1 Predicted chitinase [Lentzea albidocapillata subsp. violacea]